MKFRTQLMFCLAWLFCCAGTAMARIPYDSPSTQHKVNAGIWQFKNKEQLLVAIDRWGKNPRGGYYIINQAARKNLIGEASRYYEQLSISALNKGKESSDFNVLFAYAATVAVEYHAVSTSSDVMTATTRIELDRKKRPKAYDFRSAENQVMLGAVELFQFCDKGDTTKAQWDKALRHFRLASKLSPNWPDVYYWNGTFWKEYATKWGPRWPESTVRQFSLRAQSAMLHAKRMNKTLPFQGTCALKLSFISSDLKQHNESLRYLDEVFKYLPERKDTQLLRWQNTQRKMLQAASS